MNWNSSFSQIYVILLLCILLSFTKEVKGDWWKPQPRTTFHIQYRMDSPLDLNLPVEVYNIDMDDTPQSSIDTLHANGKKVICYLSCGSWEDWRSDANDFPNSVKGKDLDGWPGEKWLDVSNTNVLLPIMYARLDRARSKGCDGVDPDNMDGYTQDSGFTISASQQITYNKAIAAGAHSRNMSVSLKNDLSQIVSLVDFVDFAVNEQCYYFEECDYLKPFIQQNKAVYIIEYESTTSSFCADANNHNYTAQRKNLSLDAYSQYCWNSENIGGDSDSDTDSGSGSYQIMIRLPFVLSVVMIQFVIILLK